MRRPKEVHAVRLPAELVQAVDLAVERLKLWHGRSWFGRWHPRETRSRFIEKAIIERLRKMERSRRPRPRKSAVAET